METKKFRTDIKCSGCIAKVTPHLNEVVGTDNWTVDIANPSKILSVGAEVDEEKVKEAVRKAGFRIETFNEQAGT